MRVPNELFGTYGRHVKRISLQGMNKVAAAEEKIRFEGRSFDHFTIETLLHTYNTIAEHLKVYPTVTVYERGSVLAGGMSGFYYSNNHHIDIIDQYYAVSLLAHEMRHAFQHLYFPDLYFATNYRTAKDYLNSLVERDARKYALEFCLSRGYDEEVAHLREEEAQMNLVIQGKAAPSYIGLDERYFRKNPVQYQAVARNFHQEQNKYTTYGTGGSRYIYIENHERNEIEEEEYDDDQVAYDSGDEEGGGGVRTVGGVGTGIFGLFFAGGLLMNIFGGDDNQAVEQTKTVEQQVEVEYILQASDRNLLKEKDLAHLSSDELRLARNEIYARHGMVFGVDDLDAYFALQSWYEPNPNFTDSMLSELEHKNIGIILKYEK